MKDRKVSLALHLGNLKHIGQSLILRFIIRWANDKQFSHIAML
jgi:hypothetical protein